MLQQVPSSNWFLCSCNQNQECHSLFINQQKSSLVSIQEIPFLCHQFDLVKYFCTQPRDRYLKIVELSNCIFEQQRHSTYLWQVLLVVLATSENMIHFSQLYSQEINFMPQWDFSDINLYLFSHLCIRNWSGGCHNKMSIALWYTKASEERHDPFLQIQINWSMCKIFSHHQECSGRISGVRLH